MKIRERYKINKDAKVGDECICPSCNTKFIKKSYQQAFCKTKKGTKCKDKYWNTVTPEKRCNTTRISPANALWQLINLGDEEQREIDRQDRLEIELNSGDGMDVTVERCQWCGCLICRCVD